MKKKIELLAPAGDLEKLMFAIDYGADAVYIGGEVFGLRTSTKNFTVDEMREAVKYVHDRGKKLYLALNVFAHNEDLEYLRTYLKEIKDLEIDAFIISDPGIMMFVKEEIPHAEIHLSTQANSTNYMSAKFWESQGVTRVILARELSLEEITTIALKLGGKPELEAFIHGAMCMSYSGRCLLSNFMTGRDSNRGSCAMPCRWKYKIIEEKRPDDQYEIEETENGTYIFNSKDLCGLPVLAEMIEAGLSSLKIEGRSKSIYYVAEVVRVYREAIDTYYRNPASFEVKEEWLEELRSVSHREYTLGFLVDKPKSDSHLYGTSAYVRNYDFIGTVKDYDAGTGLMTVEQRGKFSVGDEVEIIGPEYFSEHIRVREMEDNEGLKIESAPHPKMLVKMKVNFPVKPGYILRVKL